VTTKNHGTDDQIERYVIGKLAEAETARLEEHLLICESCRDRAEEAENFAVSMREALKQEALAGKSMADRVGWMSWPRRPVFQMALAFVLICAALAIFYGRGSGLPPVATLQLTATRGEMPSVKPARQLDLLLAGAPADGGPFRMELVNAQGHTLWGGLADSEGDAVLVKIPVRLQGGDYFARLYSESGPMVREYGFRVGY
jgi:hypothetical protein